MNEVTLGAISLHKLGPARLAQSGNSALKADVQLDLAGGRGDQKCDETKNAKRRLNGTNKVFNEPNSTHPERTEIAAMVPSVGADHLIITFINTPVFMRNLFVLSEREEIKANMDSDESKPETRTLQ